MKLLVVTALLAQVLIPSVLARDYRYCEGNKYNLPSGLSCRDPTWTSFCCTKEQDAIRNIYRGKCSEPWTEANGGETATHWCDSSNRIEALCCSP
ncbi:hypothetical protein IAQ61_009909 [Plenodomus lingam]|uniref:uncharacterized protein n=1 Tax=Leptosphaeria maculans TaxID=5022 RepID=UPI00331F0DA1|nr:hypothetical protein IAQ61_009909 [Plenodomus lingam]